MSGLAFVAPTAHIFSSCSSGTATSELDTPELEYAESPLWTSEEELDTPSTTPETLEPAQDCFPLQSIAQRERSLIDFWTQQYRHQYHGLVRREESVLNFVQSVYRFGIEDIPFKLHKYKLPKAPLNNYLGSLAHSKGRWGVNYTFTHFLQSVLDEIPGDYRTVDGRFTVTQALGVGDTPLPSIVWSTINYPNENHFDFLALFVEVSKTGSQDLFTSDLNVDLDMLDEDDEIVYELRKLASLERPLDDLEAKSVTYLNGLMSSGVRDYATGIQVKDTTICLWYGDRFGAKKTATFDFLQQPHLLVLILSAIATASFEELGYSHCMRVRSDDIILRSFNNYHRSSLVLDNAKGPNGEEIGQQWFDFAVDDDREIFVQHGALGRGTTVIPVKKVRSLNSPVSEDEDLVAKLCWPYAGTDEDSTVRRIRTRIRTTAPGYLKHIVDIKCTVEQSMEEANLPRVFMSSDRTIDEVERVFKVIIMKAYLQLEQVSGPNDFMKIWLDVVVAHHHIYQATKYLHRDISPNNIMFYIENDTVIGVLCDWDFAEKRIPGQAFKSRRCGTPTFMAIDMLASRYPEHEYRHDLESFYWVLVWFVLNHNPVTGQCTDIAEWSYGSSEGHAESLLDIAMNKAEFIDVHQGLDPILMEHIQPCYVQMIPLITSLTGLFLAERLMAYRQRGLYGLSSDSENALRSHFWETQAAMQTLGGLRLGYSSFMEAVEDAW